MPNLVVRSNHLLCSLLLLARDDLSLLCGIMLSALFSEDWNGCRQESPGGVFTLLWAWSEMALRVGLMGMLAQKPHTWPLHVVWAPLSMAAHSGVILRGSKHSQGTRWEPHGQVPPSLEHNYQFVVFCWSKQSQLFSGSRKRDTDSYLLMARMAENLYLFKKKFLHSAWPVDANMRP